MVPWRPWWRAWMSLDPEALWLADFGITWATSTWQKPISTTIAGDLLTATAGGWAAGASSTRAIVGDGSLEFKSLEANTHKMCGLAASDPNGGFASINYSLYLTNVGSVIAYELGIFHPTTSPGYAAGDRFRIVVTGTAVDYQQLIAGIWTSIYASTVPATMRPLMADTSFATVGGTIQLLAWSGASNRVASWADLSGHGHDVAQAADASRPLGDLVSGVAPRLIFAKDRPDLLANATAVGLNVNSYSMALVRRYRYLAGVGDFATQAQNGQVYVNGQAIIQEGGAFPADKEYHWGPGLTALINASPDTVLRSQLVRYDGTNVFSRVAGVDQPAVAIGPPAAPTGPLVIGAANTAGLFPANSEISMFALFNRSLSATDAAVCGRLFGQHYGIP